MNWLCWLFGHKWRWETIANAKAAQVCSRCGEKQNIPQSKSHDD